MAGIVFSTESWHPAAERISECLAYFDARMKVIDLSKYCDALDTIGIIPFSGPNKHMSDWKERKYVSWSRREADIRLSHLERHREILLKKSLSSRLRSLSISAMQRN